MITSLISSCKNKNSFFQISANSLFPLELKWWKISKLEEESKCLPSPLWEVGRPAWHRGEDAQRVSLEGWCCYSCHPSLSWRSWRETSYSLICFLYCFHLKNNTTVSYKYINCINSKQWIQKISLCTADVHG